MDNENLLREILETQNKQLAVLGNLLKESENNNKKYRDYLAEQQITNDDYRKSLNKSADDGAQRDADRLEEHETYMRNAVTARITNYIRIISSICLVGLIGYIVIFGVGGK